MQCVFFFTNGKIQDGQFSPTGKHSGAGLESWGRLNQTITMEKKLEGNKINILFIHHTTTPLPPRHVNKLVLVSRLDGVKDKSGLTVEGLQEYYDEACLAVLNNRFAKYICLNV